MNRLLRVLLPVLAALTFASGCQICDGDPKPMIEVCNRRANERCWDIQP